MLLDNTSIWNISTGTDSHEFYLREALCGGIKRIFLEKPSTDNPEISARILEQFPDALIQINYVERAHPVVLAIIDHMKRTGFKPEYFFNWRGKDLRGSPRGIGGGQGSRICLEDLVHDISEIALIRKEVEGKILTQDSPIDAQMTTWQEIGFPYTTDVHASFIMACEKDVIAIVRGGFAENAERRYFVVKAGDLAYFGQTLTRGDIEPVAAIVKGRRNCELLQHACSLGNLINRQAIDYWMGKVNAMPIDMSAYAMPDKVKDGKPVLGWTPVARMIENLVNAKTNDDLICPLSNAVTFEKIAEQVYHKAGRPEAMEFKVLE